MRIGCPKEGAIYDVVDFAPRAIAVFTERAVDLQLQTHQAKSGRCGCFMTELSAAGLAKRAVQPIFDKQEGS